jgi:hypothetical protein
MNFPSVCTFEARADGFVLGIINTTGTYRKPSQRYNIHFGVEYATSASPVPFSLNYTLNGTNGTYDTMNGGTTLNPLDAKADTLPDGTSAWKLAHNGSL